MKNFSYTKKIATLICALMLAIALSIAPSSSVLQIFSPPKFIVKAVADSENPETVYAQLKTPVMLYKKSLIYEGTYEYEPITLLPPTYFVAITDTDLYYENTEGEKQLKEYIKVSYLDLSGYVKLTEIEITDYEPVTKYTTGTLTVYNDSQAVSLRHRPDHTDDNIIMSVNSNEKLEYYGNVDGTAIFSALGSSWYFVKVAASDDTEPIYGYIYNAYITADPIKENVIVKVEKPLPPTEETPPTDQNVTDENLPTNNIPKTYQILIIVFLCIPAALIMFFLFFKTNPNNQENKKRTPRSYKD